MKAILYLVQKEFRQIFRDKPMVGILFVVPIVQLFVFAYAVTTDLKDVRLSVLDYDRTVYSRRLTESFYTSGYFTPAPTVSNPTKLQHLLIGGEADATLWIPKGYAEDIASGGQTSVALAIDGSNSSLSGLAKVYAEAIVKQEAFRLMDDKLLSLPQIADHVRRIIPVIRFYYNPELQSRFFMVPAILVLLITIVSTMLTGMAIVKEKEIGTLEQLMVTPITPAQLIAGKTIPFIILSFMEFGIAATIAILWFHLPLEGAIWLLGLCILVYLLVTLGIGLLVSTISQTQQQAMFTIWFFLVFGILMSGFFYPVENMPDWVEKLTYLNPLRYIISIIRGIFLKGSTLPDVMPDLLPLLGIGLITFTTAVLRFRKRLG